MRPGGVDVVIPSYRRPVALQRCLAALAEQERPPDHVIVAARVDDQPTWDTARDASDELPVEVVPVKEPGLEFALVEGVAATRHPTVAFTDDDSVPHPGWLAGLTALLAEPGVGVAGGRDLIPGATGPGRRDVGTLARWGTFSGNHHLGQGPARDVHVVKGVNMAFRSEALAVPRPGVLHGIGIQMHTELMMCAWARARGWRVRYDPSILVDHRVSSDEALAGAPDSRTTHTGRAALAHNRLLGTIASDPNRAWVHITYGLLVGNHESPGVARALWSMARREGTTLDDVRASFEGQWEAAHDASALDDAMLACETDLRGR